MRKKVNAIRVEGNDGEGATNQVSALPSPDPMQLVAPSSQALKLFEAEDQEIESVREGKRVGKEESSPSSS